jgi:hypothetical protein
MPGPGCFAKAGSSHSKPSLPQWSDSQEKFPVLSMALVQDPPWAAVPEHYREKSLFFDA